jgi:hypothetical protein
MSVALKDAAWILHGYTEEKCQTGNCNNSVLVPPWYKQAAHYCDTCRAMVIDDFRSLDYEQDDDCDDTESDQ